MDLPAAIATQRREIADTLTELTADQWATSSCCEGWSVLDVAAHLTYGWHFSTARNMFEMLKAFGDLGKVNARYIAELLPAGGPAIAEDIREHAENRFKPPGLGYAAPLTDLVVHRRDMFLPLGIDYDTDPELLRLVLDKAVAGGMFGMVNASGRLRGLSFAATDLDWAHGSGPEVSGQAAALAHAMWGRARSVSELSGPGVTALEERLASP